MSESEAQRQAYTPILPLIDEAAQSIFAHEVIDLCSGGGGPWIEWMRSGASSVIRSVVLTDKFPNQAALSKVFPSGVSYATESVDASAVPAQLGGFRTLFTSYHHFPPEAARAILKDAADQRQAVGIFEFTHRSAPALLLMLLSIISVWITVPRIRPFKLSRVILTYLLPVIPFVVTFDGIVSCLRTYTPEELEAMAGEAAPNGFTWKSGLIRNGASWGLPLTYLIGVPKV